MNRDQIKEQIAQLPGGNITYKTINGKRYPYYQWSENGKQRARVVKADEFDDLSDKIEQRKALQKKLRQSDTVIVAPENESYSAVIKCGTELNDFVAPVKQLKKRECYAMLREYVYGDCTDRICILYGLRRTGKTTLIRQLIAEMSKDMLSHTAFIQITPGMDMARMNLDMKKLAEQGYRYVFIDEVTLMEDFIEGAALFSDVYASSGMKIVLSGTDSLGFMLSKSDQLYDRCILLHTTFIPYREFERVLGIKGIDEYIRYGGTMSIGGINYNKESIFSSDKDVSAYVDSAIAKNIQHSLRYYQDGGHFRHLIDLYEKNELTNAINRVVEDINHRFTADVLTREFTSTDLSVSARNLRKDKKQPISILDEIDRPAFTKRLKDMLEILNKEEQRVEIESVYASEIEEYLRLLDLVYYIDVRSFPNINDSRKRIVISQSGMRYAQAKALVNSLLKDERFNTLSLQERNAVISRILSEISGRMMEDIVLLETKMSYPDKEVFKLQFAVGEFDMVVFSPDTASCEIYEVKYSKEAVKAQCKHLLDEEKCDMTEFRFGDITGKYIIYRGKTQEANGVHYVNVEEYLKGLE